MRILFLIARYFPYSGLQTDFLRAAEAAADRGHDVTCLVGSWFSLCSFEAVVQTTA